MATSTPFQKENEKIQEMKNLLVRHYDCIGKLDAMLFLRRTNRQENIKMFIEAYELAY